MEYHSIHTPEGMSEDMGQAVTGAVMAGRCLRLRHHPVMDGLDRDRIGRDRGRAGQGREQVVIEAPVHLRRQAAHPEEQ